jgi:hypothetical protein
MENQKLQIVNNSEKSLKQLEAQEKGFSIKPSLVLLMERTEQDLKNIDNTIQDICLEFPFLKLKTLKEILRIGGLAKYGRTFKLSTQEICFWIREYQKQNKSNLL